MCGADHPDCDCQHNDIRRLMESKMIDGPPLTAAAGRDAETGLPTEWHAVIVVEGLRTTDHRAIARGALDWRQLPLPLFAQFNNAGHDQAPIVGQITEISRDGDLIMGTGTFDLGSESGREAARMCDEQTLRWGSVDLEVLESQYVEVSVDGGDSGGGDILDILFGEDVGGGESDWYDEVTAGRVLGYTMVAMPAFPQAVIAPADVELDIPEPMGAAPMVEDGLMAASVEVPAAPPASWFADPRLAEPTPLTIDGDGRVYGHLATWGTCHTGIANTCVRPPHTATDYAYFHTGRLQTANGSHVRVGQITFDTGHAGASLGWQDTTAHYDHTGTAAADVVVGEDDHGIWFAGALRPGLDDTALRAVRASALSGDWRKIGGSLELVAALAVNVPGFPIVASAGRQGEEQVSLIAAGVRRRDPVRELARELAQLKRAVAPLMGLSAERLRARMAVREPDTAGARVIDIAELKERVNAG